MTEDCKVSVTPKDFKIINVTFNSGSAFIVTVDWVANFDIECTTLKCPLGQECGSGGISPFPYKGSDVLIISDYLEEDELPAHEKCKNAPSPRAYEDCMRRQGVSITNPERYIDITLGIARAIAAFPGVCSCEGDRSPSSFTLGKYLKSLSSEKNKKTVGTL